MRHLLPLVEQFLRSEVVQVEQLIRRKKSTFMHIIEYLEQRWRDSYFRWTTRDYGEGSWWWWSVHQEITPATALCAQWQQSLNHIIKTAATYRHAGALQCQVVNSRSTSQLNDDSKDMDSLIKVVGSYIRNKIKSAEKRRYMYPDTADIKSVDHNLAILPPDSATFFALASIDRYQK